MLARHGRRNLAPDTHHSQDDPKAREDWGKKLPSALDAIVKSFAKLKPRRLMFQNKARFGRISDTRYC